MRPFGQPHEGRLGEGRANPARGNTLEGRRPRRATRRFQSKPLSSVADSRVEQDPEAGGALRVSSAVVSPGSPAFGLAVSADRRWSRRFCAVTCLRALCLLQFVGAQPVFRYNWLSSGGPVVSFRRLESSFRGVVCTLGAALATMLRSRVIVSRRSRAFGCAVAASGRPWSSFLGAGASWDHTVPRFVGSSRRFQVSACLRACGCCEAGVFGGPVQVCACLRASRLLRLGLRSFRSRATACPCGL